MDTGTKLADAMPFDTYQAARKIYNIQHIYLQIGDHLQEILSDLNLSLLDPLRSLKTDRVSRLALITAFQYAETLPDGEAAQAIRRRMDWKYALYLPIRFSGISPNDLCEFRHNLYRLPGGLAEFGRLAERLGKYGLFARSAASLPDPEGMVMAVCAINRLHRLDQALRAGLSALGSAQPDWLLEHRLPHWIERYGKEPRNFKPGLSREEMEAWSAALGADGFYLLDSLDESALGLQDEVPEVALMRRLWGEQFRREGGNILWKKDACKGCA